mgnify:CR=1 FL=1
MRWKLNSTSSAFSSRLGLNHSVRWKRTPGRSWKSQTRPSADTVQVLARLGGVCLLASGAQLLVAAPAGAQSALYEIDPDHLSVGFLVDHVGYAKVLGMFRAARGSYRFDESTATLSDVRIEIDTASVFSNQRKRDDHLKGILSLESLLINDPETLVAEVMRKEPAISFTPEDEADEEDEKHEALDEVGTDETGLGGILEKASGGEQTGEDEGRAGAIALAPNFLV